MVSCCWDLFRALVVQHIRNTAFKLEVSTLTNTPLLAPNRRVVMRIEFGRESLRKRSRALSLKEDAV